MKKKNANWNKLFIAPAFVLAAALCLTACGGGAPETTTTVAEETTTPAETTTEETTTEKAVEYKTIGEESKDAVAFQLTNKTDKDIKVFTFSAEDKAEGAENMLAEGDVFENGETRIVYIELEDEAEEETTATEENETEKVLSEAFTLGLVLEDDTALTLHSFPLNDIKEGDLSVEKEIGYIVYENLKGEKNISTLTAEQAVAEKETEEETSAEAATEAATEAAPAVEQAPAEPVYEEPVYEEPVYQEPVYQEPVYEEPVYQEPVYEEPVAENDDACVGDGLFY